MSLEGGRRALWTTPSIADASWLWVEMGSQLTSVDGDTFSPEALIKHSNITAALCHHMTLIANFPYCAGFYLMLWLERSVPNWAILNCKLVLGHFC